MRAVILGFVLSVLGVISCTSYEADERIGTGSQSLSGLVTIRRGAQGAVADTFVSASDMTKSYGSLSKLRVSAKNEALLRFELGSIPANAVINSATLTV